MRKFLLLLVSCTFVFSSLSAVAFAAQKPVKSSTIEKENELLRHPDQYKIYQLPFTTETTEVFETGDTRVAAYIFDGSGAINVDKKSGGWTAIKDLALFLGGIFDAPYIAVAALVNDVANLFGYVVPEQLSTMSTTAETRVMYNYFGKEGQVYTKPTNTWTAHWDTRSRNAYQVKLAFWYDPAHQPHSGTKTSTYPDKIQYSAHYFNDTYIRSEAYNNWYYNHFWNVETW